MSTAEKSCIYLPVENCLPLQVFREREIPSPSILPPHISLLGPFVEGELTESVVNRLAEVVSGMNPIEIQFSQFGVFPDARVMFLHPYPVEPLEALRDVLLEMLPEHKPDFDQYVYHMTLARGFQLANLSNIMDRAHAELDGYLPHSVQLKEVDIGCKTNGIWSTHRRIPFSNVG